MKKDIFNGLCKKDKKKETREKLWQDAREKLWQDYECTPRLFFSVFL
jgi:hypothetical protein